jgi:hypothetical protein
MPSYSNGSTPSPASGRPVPLPGLQGLLITIRAEILIRCTSFSTSVIVHFRWVETDNAMSGIGTFSR